MTHTSLIRIKISKLNPKTKNFKQKLFKVLEKLFLIKQNSINFKSSLSDRKTFKAALSFQIHQPKMALTR